MRTPSAEDVDAGQQSGDHAFEGGTGDLLATGVGTQARDDPARARAVRDTLAVQERREHGPIRRRFRGKGEGGELVVVDTEQPGERVGHLGRVERAEHHEVGAGGVTVAVHRAGRVGGGPVVAGEDDS